MFFLSVVILLSGWREFLSSRSFSVMVLEIDEPDYWANLPSLMASFRRLDYYVLLKWPFAIQGEILESQKCL